MPVEWTDGGVAAVDHHAGARPGQYIRRRGEDVQAGELVLRAGTRLGPAQIGLLAAVGRDRVKVRPRPRVVVMSTGSELVEPGQPTRAGPDPRLQQLHPDDRGRARPARSRTGSASCPTTRASCMDAIEDQLIRADLVITTGGVSVGAYDVVKEVLSRLGHGRVRAGRDAAGQAAGLRHDRPGQHADLHAAGQPGERPTSRSRCSSARRSAGCSGVEPLQRPIVRAVCTERVDLARRASGSSPARWLDVDRTGRYVVRPVGGPGSHLVGDLAQANALVVVPGGRHRGARPAARSRSWCSSDACS